MAQYTYDPTQGKIVLVSQARVVTYITNDPKGMPASNEAAREATGRSSGAQPQTGSAASYGLSDSQNAARLEAERIAREKSPYNVKSTAGDELLKKQAAAKAAIVSKPVSVVPAVSGIKTATTTGTAVAKPVITTGVDTAVAKLATTTGTATKVARPVPITEKDVPVNVNFAELTPEQQASIGAIGENAVVPGQKIVKSRTPKYDKNGKLIGYDVIYTDGTISSEGPDSADDEVITESGFNTDSIYTASDGTQFTDQKAYAIYQNDLTTRRLAGEAIAAEDLSKRTSAYNLLYNEFAQYGMGDLVADVKEFIMAGISPSEFTLRLRETPAYKTRFKANEGRVKAGLAAITEAEYIGLEDQYQNIMRNYGLPESYYSKGKYGTQEGFQKFIENDVSATELEDRIMTAQQRVVNANPEVMASLKAFYPGITNGDILAYTLDPKNALTDIKRKVTAAEIGGAATQAGLKTGMERAQELGAAGVTKEVAQKGFRTVAEVAPRGGELAAMYGESPYTQQTAEQEVFGLAGSADAAKQRKKLVGLERAEFSGQSGKAKGALGRERAGNF